MSPGRIVSGAARDGIAETKGGGRLIQAAPFRVSEPREFVFPREHRTGLPRAGSAPRGNGCTPLTCGDAIVSTLP